VLSTCTLVFTNALSARVMMLEFIICSAIQGHHVFKAIWENSIVGEELKCQREVGNSHDTLSLQFNLLPGDLHEDLHQFTTHTA